MTQPFFDSIRLPRLNVPAAAAVRRCFRLGLSLVVGLNSLSGLEGATGTTGRAASPVFDWPQHDWSRSRPAVVDPGTASTPEQPGKPPSDATILFGGGNLDAWVALDGTPAKWVVKEGVMQCVEGSGYVRTVEAFGDCQLHVEWAAPTPPSGTSQGRGNSGVFLMGLYEVQVLDSYENITYADGQAGAAYGQFPPLVNASRPPGQWQTYDIVFTRPRFDDRGEVTSPARLTVLHNGVLVQNNVELVGPTGWLKREPYRRHEDKLPLSLQDHGNPVRYRNVWVRELGADAKRREFRYDSPSLNKYLGMYRVDEGLTISITRPSDLLQATIAYPGRGMNFPMHAESRTKFYLRTFDGELTFQTDTQGNPQGLVFHIGGEDRVAKKVP